MSTRAAHRSGMADGELHRRKRAGGRAEDGDLLLAQSVEQLRERVGLGLGIGTLREVAAEIAEPRRSDQPVAIPGQWSHHLEGLVEPAAAAVDGQDGPAFAGDGVFQRAERRFDPLAAADHPGAQLGHVVLEPHPKHRGPREQGGQDETGDNGEQTQSQAAPRVLRCDWQRLPRLSPAGGGARGRAPPRRGRRRPTRSRRAARRWCRGRAPARAAPSRAPARIATRCAGVVPQQPPMIRAPQSRASTA